VAFLQQGLSLEEFLRHPEEEPALEFEDGLVTQKVSPKGQHSTLQGRIVERINRFSEPAKLAFAFPELRTTFGGASRVPDIAVYVWERIPRTAEGRVENDFLEPPDIAIEIVSPEQSVNALVRRCIWYVDHGVRIALLVDPQDESVLAFRPDSKPSPRRERDRIDIDDVLPGFQLSAQELFGLLSLA
jgi:Uma2 family endonuclease